LQQADMLKEKQEQSPKRAKVESEEAPDALAGGV
jgi:hypothetical protein